MNEARPIRVLLVDPDENDRRRHGLLLASWDYFVDTARDGQEAYQKFLDEPFDIVVTDLLLPRLDGFELLRRLRTRSDAPVSIVLSDLGQKLSEINLTRDLGVLSCAAKPVLSDEFRSLMERAADRSSEPREFTSAQDMVGVSDEMQNMFALLRQIAPTSASVLITGESGTGKELVARAIHRLSDRRDAPFVAVNCAAFPDGLVESELFGHERGAFTGAVERRAGCLELADGGTLLLDEVGELPPQAQAKLLRVLDDSKVRRIGGRSEIQLNVRVLAATNRLPEEELRAGNLRHDLYYRLNVFHISLPPLRERKEDLPALCTALLANLNRKHQRRVTGIDADLMAWFEHYGWPGNVRELRNTLETAVIVANEGTLQTRHLPGRFAEAASHIAASVQVPATVKGVVALPLGTTVEEAEKALIQFTLERTSQNKSRAARVLGISPKTLHCKIKRYRTQLKTASAR